MAALLGSGLAVLWMFAIGYGATSWLTWTVLGCAIIALAGLGPATTPELLGIGTWPVVGVVLIFGLAIRDGGRGDALARLAEPRVRSGVRGSVRRLHRRQQHPGATASSAASPPSAWTSVRPLTAGTSSGMVRCAHRRRSATPLPMGAVRACPALTVAFGDALLRRWRSARRSRLGSPSATRTASAARVGRARVPFAARRRIGVTEQRGLHDHPGGVGVPAQSLMSEGKVQPPLNQAQAVQLAAC